MDDSFTKHERLVDKLFGMEKIIAGGRYHQEFTLY